MPRILNSSTLVLSRDDGGGYYDVQGRWIEDPDPQENIIVKGSLQPYKDGKVRTQLPDGIMRSDAFLFYTTSFIKTADQFGDELADRTTIDNQTYYAYAVGDWSKIQSRSAHYRVIFIREDQPTGGTL